MNLEYTMMGCIIFYTLTQITICPNGTEKNCFMMSSKKMTWHEAKDVRANLYCFNILNLDANIQFCEDNKGYLIELDTEDKDTSINKYLNHNLYYWIGLNDIAQEGKYILSVSSFYLNNLAGRYVWEHSKTETQYTIWWKREWNNGPEPNGNGDCVFKDGWQESYGNNVKQFGWADYPCSSNNWKNRGIHALCELSESKSGFV